MKRKYDVLVVGGGPGGALAARTAAEKGLSACLIEKRPAIGVPVRCAEGIGKETLKEFIAPDDRWISAEIDSARFVAPDGTSMTVEQKMAGSKVGYILDRKIFDRELVWQAAAAGADVFVKSRAVSPLMDDGRMKGATVAFCGEERKVGADVVIAADGIESKFARWCGLDTTVPMRELMSCAQYVLTDIDIDPHVTVFYFGNRIAPEGYLWIFPKGDRTANVGIGISGRKSKDGHRARHLLDRFIADRFPRGKKVELIVGGVSVCRPLPCTVADGLMVVGDAARLSDPMTGGGIANAMITGRLAAAVAADAIGRGDVGRDALMPYDVGWRSSAMGKSLEKNYRIKEVFIKLDDAQLNALIQSASRLDLKDFSVLTLVKELIRRNPKMLLELKSLYSVLK